MPASSRYSENTISPDVPDIRDRPYEPTLQPLKAQIDAPSDLHILDQGQEGACTGFGLAAVINFLNQKQNKQVTVSARMLYEMALKFDEWEGEDYSGSSCRGAIKGWHSMGVCDHKLWPYSKKAGTLTVERAKNARLQTLGSYYRVALDVVDFHAALNEAGVLYCSAQVHNGWDNPVNGVIKSRAKLDGAHAFAIVGYNDRGFWVQNSWGKDWGLHGLALWTYEDWEKSIMDAWVVQLALPTPQIKRTALAYNGRSTETESAQKTKAPKREEIAGHFVHIDDGYFHDKGSYWSNKEDVQQTAKYIAEDKTSTVYQHLLFYAHGGLNAPEGSATRISKMKDVFKANGIYPFHFMYDTGLGEELMDIILNRKKNSAGRAGGFSDWSDWFLEKSTRRVGRALWREMKSDARVAFEPRCAGTETLKIFVDAFLASGKKMKFHLAGHSTGAILHAHLITRLHSLMNDITIDTCTLLAPAATNALYLKHYLPRISGNNPCIKELTIYNLNDQLEKDDTVGGAYRKSLLYLVSNAFEEKKGDSILGMQKFNAELAGPSLPNIIYSNGKNGSTLSTSHGGFDNDPVTMNHIMKRILGENPKRPFTKKDLDY